MESLNMSKKTVKNVRTATQKSGGSTLTKVGRSSSLEKFFTEMTTVLNLQVSSFEKLKARQVKKYVDHLKAQGNEDRSIQNQLSHLRQGLKSVGREHYANDALMSTKEMGVAGASRDGTHRALTKLQYRAVLAAARAHRPGAACCIALQRELGLRAREAIQSVASLKTWLKALKAGLPSQVLHGTKGGRPRWLAVIDKSRAIEAVETAIQVAKAQGGKLIIAKKLVNAARAYGRACEKVGLKGQYASHCLRCTYALDRYEMYMALHGDRKEALAAVSVDLGHGDGRGTYVAQTYLKNPPEELPMT
jgi:hypothetical protein